MIIEDLINCTTLDQLVRRVSAILKGVSDTPQLDAKLLVAHACCIAADRLPFHLQDEPSQEALATTVKLASRRLNSEPVAYILGRKEFWSLDFAVTPATLIPRPDSETLVALILDHVDTGKPLHFLDLGTGSGALIMALLAECPNATGVATDISSDALSVARTNAASLGFADRLTFCEGSWYAALKEKGQAFDIILSNPPYIEEAAINTLDPDVRGFEPFGALSGGRDGLDAYRSIISDSSKYLLENGFLALEIGYDQGDSVGALLINAGYSVTLCHDLGGNPRAIIGLRGNM